MTDTHDTTRRDSGAGNAIDELRALLDERGVRWTNHGYENHLWWKGFDGVQWHAENRYCVDGWCVKVEAVITPAQAIEATLERGECRPEEQYLDSYSELTVTVCSECGVPTDDLEDCNFCPSCGRRVVG